MTVIVLDNGAHTAKAGLAIQANPLLVPNCIMKVKSERRRAFIGRQIETCTDASGMFYMLCFQKGLLVNWDCQKAIWDYIFSSECLNIKLHRNSLIVTEPLFNLPSIQETMTEVLFEEFDCGGVFRTTASELAAYNYCSQKRTGGNCVIIDVGFSFTHIIPFVKGKQVKKAIRRIDIGGKVLTNYLKEVISYRYLNMMDETFVVNQMKEDVCFVSEDFVGDMTKASRGTEWRRDNRIEYVLPDFTTYKRGFINTDPNKSYGGQAVNLSIERITVPELLFNPSDVGINQMGIPEATMDALKDCPEIAHGILLRNVVLLGGSSLFPGFLTRLKQELQKSAPDHYVINITHPENPTTFAWHGGKYFAANSEFHDYLLRKADYEERGTQYLPST